MTVDTVAVTLCRESNLLPSNLAWNGSRGNILIDIIIHKLDQQKYPGPLDFFLNMSLISESICGSLDDVE